LDLEYVDKKVAGGRTIFVANLLKPDMTLVAEPGLRVPELEPSGPRGPLERTESVVDSDFVNQIE
jgi:hypothetical protein